MQARSFLPPGAVVLHHAQAVRELDPAGEGPREGPERRAVLAAHHHQVLAAGALGLSGEAQQLSRRRP